MSRAAVDLAYKRWCLKQHTDARRQVNRVLDRQIDDLTRRLAAKRDAARQATPHT